MTILSKNRGTEVRLKLITLELLVHYSINYLSSHVKRCCWRVSLKFSVFRLRVDDVALQLKL